MKTLSLVLFSFLCFISYDLSAQTPKQIEDDLLKSFKKIDYWRRSDLYSNDTSRYNPDSLGEENDKFSKKLMYYTSNFPFTLTQPFKSFDFSGLGMIGSADGRLRIYFWDTGMGGTQVAYENVIQYKKGQNTNSTGGANTAYDTIYTLKRDRRTYYLAIYSAKMSSQEYIHGVQVFSIENDTLNDNVKLIKTKTGLHSNIEFNYIDNSDGSGELAEIGYDEKSTILKIPVVLENGRANGNFITYKFTGQYFERVKN
ncbi:hypothetical protein ACPPVU_25690 [Mucilaginibacter sp. McL0603]|uniref:hypothetical protein n=1 Tax=Mucilaginibacter sp. McL0603 TaxID=3415670 RepID=UPI003CE7EB6C